MHSVWWMLRSTSHETFFAHDIAIKIFCDKKIKIHFSSNIFFIHVNWKFQIFWNVITIFWRKKYLVIFLFQYCVQKYCVWCESNRTKFFACLFNVIREMSIVLSQMFVYSNIAQTKRKYNKKNTLFLHIVFCTNIIICHK